jgi:hypothetical protein
MNRQLRYSAALAICMGLMAFVIIIPLLAIPSATGKRLVDCDAPTIIFALVLCIVPFAAITAFGYSTSVTVTDNGLTIKTLYVLMDQISFDEIDHYDVECFRYSPMRLSIYRQNRGAAFARIRLISVKQEDAAWICSLPQLKPRLTNFPWWEYV